MSSLTAMIQKGMQNEVPQNVLEQCPPEDKVLIENILLLAQTELEALNLAGTTITCRDSKVFIKCALAGNDARISLSAMRNIQNFSPARIVEVRAQVLANTLYLYLDIADANTRITCSELEVIRVRKRKRVLFM